MTRAEPSDGARRRRRALALLLLALLAAAAAAAIADRYGSRVARGYGSLRPVVVLDASLRAGRRIGPDEVGRALTVRRVPARFVPAGALASPQQALGLVARTLLPAGSYLLGTQLGPPRRRSGIARLSRYRHPVEIAVGGAVALLEAGALRPGAAVDVVVTKEASTGGRGHTYVAAATVPLLALRPQPEDPEGSSAAATLALTKRQALRLIAAESFAREIRLLPVR